jgi:hypothetical protein
VPSRLSDLGEWAGNEVGALECEGAVAVARCGRCSGREMLVEAIAVTESRWVSAAVTRSGQYL